MADFTEFEFSIIILLLGFIVFLLFLFICKFFRFTLTTYSSRIFQYAYILSIVLYISSLFFVGYYDNRGGDNEGIWLVVFGTVAFLGGGASISWLANPFLWYSLAMKNNSKKSFTANIFSFLFVLSFLMFDTISGGGTVFGTDGPVGSCDVDIIGYGLGYYLWLSSSSTLLIANYIRQDHEKKFIFFKYEF